MSNVWYISINKQLTSIQDCFGVLSQLCQGKGYKTFSHSKCRCGQHNSVKCNVAHELWVKWACTRLWAEQSRVQIPAGARDIFHSQKCPHHLWGPPSHLFHRYWGSFPGNKFDHSLHLVTRLKMNRATSLPPLYALWYGQRKLYLSIFL